MMLIPCFASTSQLKCRPRAWEHAEKLLSKKETTILAVLLTPRSRRPGPDSLKTRASS